MDLISEKWLPVTLSSGKKTKISLSELIDDTVIDLAWPRSDFQGAAWQMLIGVMQCRRRMRATGSASGRKVLPTGSGRRG